MARWLRIAQLVVAALCLSSGVARAHDVTTRVTWNREISRIVFRRCATCHQPGGSAFSLVTYREASPWAGAIKAQVLLRQMPPWGAVRGFGTFRNETALGQEEIDLITNWVDGGFPEGNPEHLPLVPNIPARTRVEHARGELAIRGDERLPGEFLLDGFWVTSAPSGGTAQITLRYPDGRIEPLVWLRDYRPRDEPFLRRKAVVLPAGTIINGLNGAQLLLIPASTVGR